MKRSVPAIAGAAVLAGAATLGFTPALAAEAAITLPPPRLTYTSVLAGVPGHADAAPIEWVRSNALVGKLKGHAGHLRGSATPPPAPAPTAPPAPPPAGHGIHGAPSSSGRTP